MNVDRILSAFNTASVDYVLIGGLNFLLRHGGPSTFDADIWIQDNDDNLWKVINALQALNAEWGATDASWGPVRSDLSWLKSQSVFCLVTSAGGVDIFREVRGLEGRYTECKTRATRSKTATGVEFLGLGDADMLQTQLALEAVDQKMDRITALRKAINP